MLSGRHPRRTTPNSTVSGQGGVRKSLHLASTASVASAAAKTAQCYHRAFLGGGSRERWNETECPTAATDLPGPALRFHRERSRRRSNVLRQMSATIQKRAARQLHRLGDSFFCDLAVSPAVADEIPRKPALHVGQ